MWPKERGWVMTSLRSSVRTPLPRIRSMQASVRAGLPETCTCCRLLPPASRACRAVWPVAGWATPPGRGAREGFLGAPPVLRPSATGYYTRNRLTMQMFRNIPSSSCSLLSPTFLQKGLKQKQRKYFCHLDSGIDYVKLFEGRAVGANGVDVNVKVDCLHFEAAQLSSLKW